MNQADDLNDDPFDSWYSPAIDRAALRAMMRRTNHHGLVSLGIWCLLCLATGALVVAARGTLWVWPTMLIYGGVLCFAYAVSHECAHGTAFKSRWLNESVFWFTSLVFIEEPLYRRYSHAGHHTNTWFNDLDPQKPYGNPISLWAYISGTFGLRFYYDAAKQLVRHSLGHFSAQEIAFVPIEEIKRAKINSRVMFALYAALLFGGIIFRSPWPFLLYFIPRFLGGCIVMLFINTQHMCMAEDLYDHRETTRSIKCGWLSRRLYWNMNHHIEHHLYPAVPFHALPALSEAIASQLPPPVGGMIAANLAILKAIARQRTEPRYNLSPAD
jgi:fatty acid desaturase